MLNKDTTELSEEQILEASSDLCASVEAMLRRSSALRDVLADLVNRHKEIDNYNIYEITNLTETDVSIKCLYKNVPNPILSMLGYTSPPEVDAIACTHSGRYQAVINDGESVSIVDAQIGYSVTREDDTRHHLIIDGHEMPCLDGESEYLGKDYIRRGLRLPTDTSILSMSDVVMFWWLKGVYEGIRSGDILGWERTLNYLPENILADLPNTVTPSELAHRIIDFAKSEDSINILSDEIRVSIEQVSDEYGGYLAVADDPYYLPSEIIAWMDNGLLLRHLLSSMPNPLALIESEMSDDHELWKCIQETVFEAYALNREA